MVIIFPHDAFELPGGEIVPAGVSTIFPTGALPIEEVARKDVPQGKPFLIVAEVPDEPDFTNPDGHGDPAGWSNNSIRGL